MLLRCARFWKFENANAATRLDSAPDNAVNSLAYYTTNTVFCRAGITDSCGLWSKNGECENSRCAVHAIRCGGAGREEIYGRGAAIEDAGGINIVYGVRVE